MTICPICRSDQIRKGGFLNGGSQRYYCKNHKGWVSDSPSARVLVFDIETLPILGYVWDVWEQNVSMDAIVKDWCVLSWSAKWLGDNKMVSDILTPKEARDRNDQRIVKSLWKLLDSADLVITQNGRRFDIRKINARLLYYSIPPPSSYRTIDTFVEAKSLFALTFHKQEWMARYLHEPRKLDTNLKLWIDCDQGKPEALKKMLAYNVGDVIGLERIYSKLRPYIPNHPNLTLAPMNDNTCPRCFGELVPNHTFYRTNKNKFKEYRCKSCKGLTHDTKATK